MYGLFIRLSSVIVACIIVASCDTRPSISRDKVQEAWDDYNNPAMLDSGAVVQFSDLPTFGVASKIPWADTYWPSHMGGIAVRWKNGFEAPFSTVRPSEFQVRAMSQLELASLSPAEKYDIFMGRFDYPTVQAELLRTHPAMPTWAGLCHGWSAASLNFDEPGAVIMRGANGIDVPFASGDIKALLAYAQGVVFPPMNRVLGQRCDVDLTTVPQLRNSAECRDTNAGSFHLILANFIGRSGQSVIADLTRDAQVWNFPIYGYATRELLRRPPSPGASVQAVVEIVVETDVDFMSELERPNWVPLIDSRSYAAERVTYQYTVELDSLGRVVGGGWLTEERPDFLWTQERAEFRGYYGSIESIYQSSRDALNLPSQPQPVSTAAPEPIGIPPTPTLPPLPTPPPVPTAAPVPTLPPVPTAAPVPTLPPVPTAAPVPAPGEPVGGGTPPTDSTVGGQPPITSRPVDLDLLSCSLGWSVAWEGMMFCVDSDRVFAPLTALMFQRCVQAGELRCHEPLWNFELYTRFRGKDVCPVGSQWDQGILGCVEGTSVLGPFGSRFTSDCLASGFGNLCHSLKVDLAYYSIVIRKN